MWTRWPTQTWLWCSALICCGSRTPPWRSAPSDRSTTSHASCSTYMRTFSASEKQQPCIRVYNPHHCALLLCVANFMSVVNEWRKVAGTGYKETEGEPEYLCYTCLFFSISLSLSFWAWQNSDNHSFILLRSCSDYDYHGTGLCSQTKISQIICSQVSADNTGSTNLSPLSRNFSLAQPCEGMVTQSMWRTMVLDVEVMLYSTFHTLPWNNPVSNNPQNRLWTFGPSCDL